MSRRCELTGRGPATGNNVSHANNKTRRRFLINLKPLTARSEALGRVIRMRVSTRVIRTITKHGGIDNFLMRTPEAKLTPEGAKLKRAVAKSLAGGKKKQAAAAS